MFKKLLKYQLGYTICNKEGKSYMFPLGSIVECCYNHEKVWQMMEGMLHTLQAMPVILGCSLKVVGIVVVI